MVTIRDDGGQDAPIVRQKSEQLTLLAKAARDAAVRFNDKANTLTIRVSDSCAIGRNGRIDLPRIVQVEHHALSSGAHVFQPDLSSARQPAFEHNRGAVTCLR